MVYKPLIFRIIFVKDYKNIYIFYNITSMKISNLYDIFKQYPQITTDSRKCTNGSIFFALKGANFNGNTFAEKALELGCSFAVVDEAQYAVRPNILLVEDCLETLQQLAKYHRQQLKKLPLIAITGTNGKTTTKELVAAVLSQEYNILYTQGNLNNHIGVPLTLLRLRKEHEIAVVEMGASHVEEIKMLSELAEPDYGLITNIGYAHLEGFGSYENIIKTKGELYDYILENKHGKLFVDYDNAILRKMSDGITSLYYGQEEGLFITGKVLSANPYLEIEWIMGNNCLKRVQTNLIGSYNLTNALAAISIGKYFGVKSELICKALQEYQPTNNRSQLLTTKTNKLIIDAYNANPTSMGAALENFDKMQNIKNKVLILGDMKELGADSDTEHQKIADYITCHQFDNVFLVGDNFYKVNTKHHQFRILSDLEEFLKKQPIRNSYILLKGSRSVQLEKIIPLL